MEVEIYVQNSAHTPICFKDPSLNSNFSIKLNRKDAAPVLIRTLEASELNPGDQSNAGKVYNQQNQLTFSTTADSVDQLHLTMTIYQANNSNPVGMAEMNPSDFSSQNDGKVSLSICNNKATQLLVN